MLYFQKFFLNYFEKQQNFDFYLNFKYLKNIVIKSLISFNDLTKYLILI
jgi:hypothetical protein